ncbi:phBC6A51 family helix-turn-helix protein [Psychrobacillus sp. OK032]|uniref:phBC6A51 family helix-turn-helix protein n=1 Tax=Psychrobacillus sp. OK032 TaxID=1884358 RepID=UPI0008AEE5C8|nr:phBC6A51 family helix-turn-helix protein [Psychrobacillus sp. OK032]SER87544.1 Helix-turn-helix of insertion element transposase [Psychrobacillus sp. OK032]
MAKLNEQQIAAVTILAQPKRAGLTYAQIAAQIGVNRDTLYEWRKRDDFNDALKRQIVANTLDSLPEVMASVSGHIIESGNAAMLRTLLQAHGMLSEKIDVTTTDKGTDIDAIKAEIESLRKG